MEARLVKHKIELMEHELHSLKNLILKKGDPVSLHGNLKGVTISEEDIEDAKRSLFFF